MDYIASAVFHIDQQTLASQWCIAMDLDHVILHIKMLCFVFFPEVLSSWSFVTSPWWSYLTLGISDQGPFGTFQWPAGVSSATPRIHLECKVKLEAMKQENLLIQNRSFLQQKYLSMTLCKHRNKPRALFCSLVIQCL